MDININQVDYIPVLTPQEAAGYPGPLPPRLALDEILDPAMMLTKRQQRAAAGWPEFEKLHKEARHNGQRLLAFSWLDGTRAGLFVPEHWFLNQKRFQGQIEDSIVYTYHKTRLLREQMKPVPTSTLQ
jgi:hypothetical protein